MDTFNSLLARALIVMNERLKEMNTATRVGSLFRDIIYYLQNMILGIILKGEKANEAAIKATANPQRGDTWKAADTGHYWTYDGSSWNDIGDVLPANVATKDDIAQIKDDIAQMEFDLSIRVNVPIVFDAAGYYRRTSPTKTLVESGTLNSMSIPVSDGNTFICSFKLGVGSSMAGIMFFDSAGNNKGYLYQGDGQEYQNVLISVPAGLDITEMAYCSVINWENNKIEKLSTDIDGAIKKVSSDVSEL